MNSHPTFLEPAAAILAPLVKRQTLLDTKSVHDAHICGYDGPCDPMEDCEGLVIAAEAGVVLSVSFITSQGSAELCGAAEIKAARDALNAALKIAGAA